VSVGPDAWFLPKVLAEPLAARARHAPSICASCRIVIHASDGDRGVRAAIVTHDRKLIQQITAYAESQGLGKNCLEFQMLYGIQTEEQYRLAREGWKSIVLVAYGSYWFPWYMRRLAERPANAWFVLRNLFAT